MSYILPVAMIDFNMKKCHAKIFCDAMMGEIVISNIAFKISR
jgi:hypothetical protein